MMSQGNERLVSMEGGSYYLIDRDPPPPELHPQLLFDPLIGGGRFHPGNIGSATLGQPGPDFTGPEITGDAEALDG